MSLHEPLKITFRLEVPAAIERKSAIDSLLAKVHFNLLKERGEFDGDYQAPLDFLKMTDGVYHTSWPVFEKDRNLVWYEKGILLKRLDERGMNRMVDFKTSGKPNVSSARYKNDFYAVELLPYDEVVYYVCGEKRVISELLSHVTSLGKKSGLGWGAITKDGIFIESISEDRSVLHKGILYRNLPIDNSFGYEGENIAFCRLTHPYWERTGQEPCYLPEDGAWR